MKELTNREFVEIWLRSTTLEEVAKASGYTLYAASQKGSKLRMQGVRLPRLRRKAKLKPTTVDDLNRLIVESIGTDSEYE